MKANETFERYDGKVRECCNYAVRSSKSFMENADTNKRQAGGKAELVLRDQLTKDLKEFCDEVDEVSFYAKQKAYITSNLLTFIFMVATAVFVILFSLVNPYFILAALVTALLSLLAALGVFGGTSKSVEDINVFARRKSTGEPAARIIFEANLDAPFKRNISRGTAALLKFLTLLGAYAACGAMRYMSEQDLRLESTELCVLLTSSKEAKNAGAKAFVRDFKADLDALDTTILCFDSIYDPDSLNVVSKGRKVSKLIDEAAANAGVLLTDHEPKYHKGNLKVYDKAGLSAAQISTLPDTAPAFYRNEHDDADLLTPDAVHAVEGAIKVALEAAYALDAQDA